MDHSEGDLFPSDDYLDAFAEDVGLNSKPSRFREPPHKIAVKRGWRP